MEFVKNIVDKKLIQKTDIGINPFLIESNLNQIEKIARFLNTPCPLLLVNGFLGTGKVHVVNQALSFLADDVITLKYNCFETTVLDDILLEFFDNFKKFTAQGIIQIPKARTENFTQKINAYFESIDKPVVIVLNSFEQVLKEFKQEILDFLFHLSKSYKIKTIIISRKFDYEDFKQNYERLAITAFDKGIFEKYLRKEGFKQIGPLSDELYKHTRGYYFYTTLALKIMQIRKLSLADFLSGYSQSFLSFNDFILREALSLVDPVSGHLLRFLTVMRHPVNIKLLKMLNLYDADRIAYFTDNMVLTREGSMIYLQDYYKTISENSIADNIAVKIHKSCVELYNTQLPLKPLERDLLVSRQTMRREIDYHSLFIPKKPQLQQKAQPELQFIQQIQISQPKTIKEKEEQIKNISFVFESEADEMAIMNKIAASINKFVDISDKNIKTLEAIKGKSLIDLINMAKQEEMNFDYHKAVMFYQKALTMNTDDDYYTFLPMLYSQLAKAFKNMSDWFNAQKYFELAVEFYVSTGDIQKINEYKYEIANIYYLTFKRDKAEILLKEIISESISLNLKTKAHLLLSSITGNSIELVENTSEIEKPVLAELYFKYALNHDEQGDLEIAVKYYKKCVETSQDIKVNAYLSSSLSNLASIYDENGKSELAIKYLHESLRLDELSKNLNGIYLSSVKLAEIASNKNSSKTLEYLKKAKSCAIELNEPFYIVSSNVALGDYFNSKKDYKQALNYYNDAVKVSGNDSDENIQKIKQRINDIKKVTNEN